MPDSEKVRVNVGPGVALEVEYEQVDYQMAADGDEEVPGRLTGCVRMRRGAIWDAQWADPMTGQASDI